MARYKYGDTVVCRLELGKFRKNFQEYDQEEKFLVIADYDPGCIIYIPDFLFVKDDFIADEYICKIYKVPPKFIECSLAFVDYDYVLQHIECAPGLACVRCKEFNEMVSVETGQEYRCWSCKTYPYR